MKPASLAAIVALGATVTAQQPTFRAGTTLIAFTVVATDSSGNPVTDLKPGEVTIAEGRQTWPVAFFRFEGDAGIAGATGTTQITPIEPRSPGIFTNRPEYSPGPPRNVTAIVIDSLNTLPEDQVAVRAQVMRYLRALAPDTRVAIYATGERLRILHDFTADLDALRARLSTMSIDYNVEALGADEAVRLQLVEAEHLDKAVDAGSSSDGETDADQQAEAEYRKQIQSARQQMARLDEYFYEQLHKKRIDLTMRSLESLGNHLAGIAGRKNLVWISGGIPILTIGAYDRWMSNYEPRIRAVAQRLASQGITIYPVQASALQVGILGTASRAEGSSRGQPESVQLRPLTREHDQRLWSTMDVLADVTGGRSFKNTNDLTAGVKAAANDLRGSYSVGFYAPEQTDSRWHELRVRVSRPGVRVLHRKGYLALGPVKQPQNWSQDEWQAAMQNPLGSTAIRLDARADVAQGGINVLMQIAYDDLHFKRADDQAVADLEIGLGERNQKEWTRVRRDGATITIKEDPQKTARPSIVRFSKLWTLNPDSTVLRLIVRDRLSGRFGVLDMPLTRVGG